MARPTRKMGVNAVPVADAFNSNIKPIKKKKQTSTVTDDQTSKKDIVQPEPVVEPLVEAKTEEEPVVQEVEKVVEQPQPSVSTGRDSLDNAVDEFFGEMETEKVEDTHKRVSFLLDNDLVERLEKVSKNKPKGYKHRFYNTAIALFLERIEEQDGKKKANKK